MFWAFVPFFAFERLEGVLGKAVLRDLFWRCRLPAVGEDRG